MLNDLPGQSFSPWVVYSVWIIKISLRQLTSSHTWYKRKGKNPLVSGTVKLVRRYKEKTEALIAILISVFFTGRLVIRAPMFLSLPARFMGANQHPRKRKKVKHLLSLLCTHEPI